MKNSVSRLASNHFYF